MIWIGCPFTTVTEWCLAMIYNIKWSDLLRLKLKAFIWSLPTWAMTWLAVVSDWCDFQISILNVLSFSCLSLKNSCLFWTQTDVAHFFSLFPQTWLLDCVVVPGNSSYKMFPEGRLSKLCRDPALLFIMLLLRDAYLMTGMSCIK